MKTLKLEGEAMENFGHFAGQGDVYNMSSAVW